MSASLIPTVLRLADLHYYVDRDEDGHAIQGAYGIGYPVAETGEDGSRRYLRMGQVKRVARGQWIAAVTRKNGKDSAAFVAAKGMPNCNGARIFGSRESAAVMVLEAKARNSGVRVER